MLYRCRFKHGDSKFIKATQKYKFRQRSVIPSCLSSGTTYTLAIACTPMNWQWELCMKSYYVLPLLFIRQTSYPSMCLCVRMYVFVSEWVLSSSFLAIVPILNYENATNSSIVSSSTCTECVVIVIESVLIFGQSGHWPKITKKIKRIARIERRILQIRINIIVNEFRFCSSEIDQQVSRFWTGRGHSWIIEIIARRKTVINKREKWTLGVLTVVERREHHSISSHLFKGLRWCCEPSVG